MKEFCQEWGSFVSLKFDVFTAVAHPQEEDCGDDRKEAVTRCCSHKGRNLLDSL